jgi:hypothetical protein
MNRRGWGHMVAIDYRRRRSRSCPLAPGSAADRRQSRHETLDLQRKAFAIRPVTDGRRAGQFADQVFTPEVQRAGERTDPPALAGLVGLGVQCELTEFARRTGLCVAQVPNDHGSGSRFDGEQTERGQPQPKVLEYPPHVLR